MRYIFMLMMLFMTFTVSATVQEYTLDNGLKILVKPDTRAPVAVVMLWYNVGSADELPGKTGLAHALEHMMFKGTKSYPPGYFSKTISKIGGQENAFTNSDYTAYFATIASSQLPSVLKLEAERMRNLIIDKDEFAKEIKVIREERRMRTDDNPQGALYERFMASAHLAAPYQHPVIGWMSDLHQMTSVELEQWYQQYYAPNNAVLVVVGDVKPAHVLNLAKRYFGSLKPSELSARKNYPEPPALGKKTVEVLVPAKLPMLMLGYAVPSVNTAKEQWKPYALEVLAGILSGGDSARFAKFMIRGSQTASAADVYYDPFSRYSTQFVLMATPSSKESLGPMEKDLQSQIHSLQTSKVSAEELARVKTQIIAQKVYQKDSIFGQAMELGMLETIGVGWKVGEDFSKHIEAISAEQIQMVAKEYLIAERLTRAELIPQAHTGSAQ